MRSLRRLGVFPLVAFAILTTSLPCFAQRVTATLATNLSFPDAIGINSLTNKTYIADGNLNTVTVIDGASNQLTTVAVGNTPLALGVNPVTNKIYVANAYDNTVTVIDGATLNTAAVPVGEGPVALAVNSATNMVYVANADDNTVTVINGSTLATTTVTVGDIPLAVAVNSTTNKIYVGDKAWVGNSYITVIDGATNNATTVELPSYAEFFNDYNGNNGIVVNPVSNQIYAAGVYQLYDLDGATNNVSTAMFPGGSYAYTGLEVNPTSNQIYLPDVSQYPNNVIVVDGATLNAFTVNTGNYPDGLAIDSATNKIYVANEDDSTLTTIDGVTNSTVTVGVGSAPILVAANPVSNVIYVANDDGTVSVVAGAGAVQFVSINPPCRVVDTRQHGGNGPILGGTYQSFNLTQLGNCNVPTTAAAYSLNVTVVPQGPLGYLTIWPDGQPQPAVSTMNSDGRVKANAAIVPAGALGAVDVYVSNTSNVILDINGYFTPPSGSTLAFYPLTPCRLVDTRQNNLGGPYLQGGQERDFNLQESSNNCIPQNLTPSAYSLNITAVPHPSGLPLSYLTVWPAGQTQPVVSTLNNPTGTIVANAAIVTPGSDGDVAVYPTNDTDLLIDINGYFAPPASGGLSLYTEAPCRVLDTRSSGGAFSGELTAPVATSACPQPTTAQAYVFNATVVPTGSLGYLTLWPDGQQQPVVSTLNAVDGAITSNMAIVPTTNGSIDAYAAGLTQLILDISSYFAP